jgi:signal transduction histidine kinase
METLDLSALLLQTVEYVQIICSHSHIILSHFIAKDVTVSGNKEQLREAITNILSNAVKYTAPCGLRKITVSLLAEAEQVILTIADTGVGISPDRVSYIFNRERREGTVGTGLGLTIVKTIIEKHHGSIEVESSIGKGTCFIVRLPENS